MNKLVVFFLFFLIYRIDIYAQSTQIMTAFPLIKFDSIVKMSTDTFSYLKKQYIIKTNKKNNVNYLPRIYDNNVLFFIDTLGNILNFNVISYELTLPVNGASATYHINGYRVFSQDFEKIKINEKATLTKIIFKDLSNIIYKNQIKELEVIRIK